MVDYRLAVFIFGDKLDLAEHIAGRHMRGDMNMRLGDDRHQHPALVLSVSDGIAVLAHAVLRRVGGDQVVVIGHALGGERLVHKHAVAHGIDRRVKIVTIDRIVSVPDSVGIIRDRHRHAIVKGQLLARLIYRLLIDGDRHI